MYESICSWCNSPFNASHEGQEYCGRECRMEAWVGLRKACYGIRLHNGMRLLSDDFGEQPGDSSVLYQK